MSMPGIGKNYVPQTVTTMGAAEATRARGPAGRSPPPNLQSNGSIPPPHSNATAPTTATAKMSKMEMLKAKAAEGNRKLDEFMGNKPELKWANRAVCCSWAANVIGAAIIADAPVHIGLHSTLHFGGPIGTGIAIGLSALTILATIYAKSKGASYKGIALQAIKGGAIGAVTTFGGPHVVTAMKAGVAWASSPAAMQATAAKVTTAIIKFGKVTAPGWGHAALNGTSQLGGLMDKIPFPHVASPWIGTGTDKLLEGAGVGAAAIGLGALYLMRGEDKKGSGEDSTQQLGQARSSAAASTITYSSHGEKLPSYDDAMRGSAGAKQTAAPATAASSRPLSPVQTAANANTAVINAYAALDKFQQTPGRKGLHKNERTAESLTTELKLTQQLIAAFDNREKVYKEHPDVGRMFYADQQSKGLAKDHESVKGLRDSGLADTLRINKKDFEEELARPERQGAIGVEAAAPRAPPTLSAAVTSAANANTAVIDAYKALDKFQQTSGNRGLHTNERTTESLASELKLTKQLIAAFDNREKVYKAHPDVGRMFYADQQSKGFVKDHESVKGLRDSGLADTLRVFEKNFEGELAKPERQGEIRAQAAATASPTRPTVIPDDAASVSAAVKRYRSRPGENMSSIGGGTLQEQMARNAGLDGKRSAELTRNVSEDQKEYTEQTKKLSDLKQEYLGQAKFENGKWALPEKYYDESAAIHVRLGQLKQLIDQKS